MGILERTLGAISPGWAAARARDRLRLNAYEAANPSRLHKAKKQSQSADTSVFAAGQSLREQARWLDENHDLVIGLFDKMEDRVIGAHGIHVEPQPLDLEGNLHSDFAGQLSALWAEWSVRPEVTGMFTRPEAERLLLRSALRDGEVFTQMVRGNVAGLQHSTQVPFSLELLEADFVPFNLNSTSGQQIRQGIIVNAWGRPTGYRVYKNHPASFAGLNADLKTVSADSMLHLAMRKPIALATYGELFSIDRQTIINDDLDMLTRIPQAMGLAARATVGDLVWAVLTSNPKMSDDKPLFHADHGNLVTADLTIEGLDTARKAMLLQKSGDRRLNIRPAYMLTPVAIESRANQLIKSASVPGADANSGIVNPIQNFVTVASEARLDDSSPTDYYLTAAQGRDTIEVAYLDGIDTPYLEQQQGFTVDGAAFKVRIDAGVAPLDWRGLVKVTKK
ncbi:phage portal protein [Citrobacter freundii]|nr:phage portal protein [Citrobacter freundii]QMA47859.1 phage portal protein [Citrobacter freundii]